MGPVTCIIPETYDCIEGNCIDPGDGSGLYQGMFALTGCQNSCTCGEIGVSAWYIKPSWDRDGTDLANGSIQLLYTDLLSYGSQYLANFTITAVDSAGNNVIVTSQPGSQSGETDVFIGGYNWPHPGTAYQGNLAGGTYTVTWTDNNNGATTSARFYVPTTTDWNKVMNYHYPTCGTPISGQSTLLTTGSNQHPPILGWSVGSNKIRRTAGNTTISGTHAYYDRMIKNYYTGLDANGVGGAAFTGAPMLHLSIAPYGSNFPIVPGVNDKFKYSLGDDYPSTTGCFPVPGGPSGCTNCCPQNEVSKVIFYLDVNWEKNDSTKPYMNCGP